MGFGAGRASTERGGIAGRRDRKYPLMRDAAASTARVKKRNGKKDTSGFGVILGVGRRRGRMRVCGG